MHKRVEGEATVKEVGGAPTHKDCPMEAHSKLKRDDNDDGFLADDRLSTLPDCLLHEIMSYLKLQELVQTSMLSKRWMPLWRSMTSLNVDQEEFKVAANALMAVKCNTAHELVEWVKFEKFTDHLLIRHNVDAALLISFRLHISNSSRGEQAARWIRHLIKYGSAMVPGTPWNLKKLHISNVNLDGRLSEHMRSRCPSLVDLELKGCKCEMYEIASDSLKKLVLEDCDFRGLAAITTPKLESFAFNGGRITGKCPLVIMAPAVDDVAMSVSNSAAGVHLHGVSNVTRLDLSCIVVVALTEEFAQFNNLRDLSLKDYCRLTDSFEKLLEQFIWSSPNLENLNVCRCKACSAVCTGIEDIHSKKKPMITEIKYIEEEHLLRQVKLLLKVPGDIYLRLTKVGPINSFAENLTKQDSKPLSVWMPPQSFQPASLPSHGPDFSSWTQPPPQQQGPHGPIEITLEDFLLSSIGASGHNSNNPDA